MPLEILQDVGSYAGLAAIVGLAVLSVLYFSQARDVKRLREWAGRAPERSAEEAAQAAAAPAPSGAVVARPQPKAAPQPAGGAQPAGAPQPAGAQQPAGAPEPAAKPAGPRPAGAPALAQASATGAAPASAVAAEGSQGDAPAVATPAGEAKQAAATGDAERLAQAPPPEGEEVVAEREEGVAEPEEVGADREGVPAEREQVAAAAAQPAVAAGGAQSAAARRQEGVAAPGARQGDTQEQEALVPPQAAPVPQATAAARAGTPAPEAPRPGGGTQAPPRPATGSRPAPPPRPPGRAPSVPRAGVPGRPGRAGTARPAQTAIIPPPSRARLSSRLLASPRYLVLAIAGLLIVGGGALFGLSQVGSEERGTGSQSAGGGGAAQEDGGSAERRRPIAPAEVTVAVLNGTTVPGLAAQIGDRIETLGFDLGTVTNSTDQERAESVVLFAPDHQREAAVVGRRLGIAQRERVDAESQGLAGDATVVVIAGIDQTQ